jgi:hypothetical protein
VCRVLYKGLKNFYNSTSGTCLSVAACKDNQKYDYLTNLCQQTKFDNSLFPNTTNSLNKTESEKSIQIPKIKCLNGEEIPDSQICVCYSGWTDDNSSNTNGDFILKCNQIIPGFSNLTFDNSTVKNPTSSFFISKSGSNITVTDILPVQFYNIDTKCLV